MVLLLVIVCLLTLVVAAIIIGVALVMGAGRRDTVSEAREDWLTRRSDKDERGW
jgi:hypothetical protein